MPTNPLACCCTSTGHSNVAEQATTGDTIHGRRQIEHTLAAESPEGGVHHRPIYVPISPDVNGKPFRIESELKVEGKGLHRTVRYHVRESDVEVQ